MRESVERGRFELDVEGRVVHADYRREPGTIVILHVYAPPALRGTGAAGRLMTGIAGLARDEGVRIRALCHYAHGWLAARPEHRDLLLRP